MSDVCNEFERDVLPTLHGEPSSSYQQACLILGVLMIIYFATGFGLFVYAKQYYQRLKVKSTLVNFIIMISFVSVSALIFFREYIGRDHVPCLVHLWIYYLSQFLACGSYVAHQYSYLYKLRMERERGYHINMMMKQQQQPKATQLSTNDKAASQLQRQSSLSTNEYHQKQFSLYLVWDFLNILKYSKNGRIIAIEDADNNPINGQNNNNNNNNTTTVASSPNDDIERLSTTESDSNNSNTNAQFAQFLNLHTHQSNSKSLKDNFALDVLLPCFLVFGFGLPLLVAAIVRSEVDPLLRNGCDGCSLSKIDYYVFLYSSTVSGIFIRVGLHAMRNEADPLGIFHDARLIGLAGMISVTGWILQIIDPGNYYKDYKFSWDIFYAVGIALSYSVVSYKMVFQAIAERKYAENEYNPNAIQDSNSEGPTASRALTVNIGSPKSNKAPLKSKKYSSKKIPKATAIDVDHLLNEPRARTALLEHCIDELSSENLVFVFKVRSWKSIWEKDSQEKVNRIATAIYQEYLATGAKSLINIPNGLASKVQQEMDKYVQKQKQDGDSTSEAAKVSSLTSNSDARPMSSGQRRSMGKIPMQIFDDCEKECIAILRTDTLPRFVKSKLFAERILDTGILNKILIQ